MKKLFFEELRSTEDFVMVMSTTVDSNNPAVIGAFMAYNNLPAKLEKNKAKLTLEAADALQLHMSILGKYPHIKSVGYWEGKEQPNSWMFILPKELAKEYVENAPAYFGQDSIIAFGPDCGIEVYNEPKDFCTKVGDSWVRFDFSGEYYETPPIDGTAGVQENDNPLEELRDILGEATIPEVPSDYTAETLVDIAYEVAPNIYYKRNWSNTSMDRDEFTQLAAVYIYEKYNEGYFEGKTSDEIIPMVIGMLQGWFIRNTHMTEIDKAKRNPSLNTPASSDSDTESLELIPDETGLQPDDFVSEMDYKIGKSILEGLLDNFSTSPFPSRKHKYIAKNIPGFGRDVEASERLLIDLVLAGKSVSEIAGYFRGAPIDNAGYYSHDSKSSYISHKVRHAVSKLADLINNLDNDEQLMVKDYIEALMKGLLK